MKGTGSTVGCGNPVHVSAIPADDVGDIVVVYTDAVVVVVVAVAAVACVVLSDFLVEAASCDADTADGDAVVVLGYVVLVAGLLVVVVVFVVVVDNTHGMKCVAMISMAAVVVVVVVVVASVVAGCCTFHPGNCGAVSFQTPRVVAVVVDTATVVSPAVVVVVGAVAVVVVVAVAVQKSANQSLLCDCHAGHPVTYELSVRFPVIIYSPILADAGRSQCLPACFSRSTASTSYSHVNYPAFPDCPTFRSCSPSCSPGSVHCSYLSVTRALPATDYLSSPACSSYKTRD